MEVRNDLVVSAGGEIAWAFRKDSPILAAVINDFAQGHRQGTLIGNVLINRYMENLDWVRNSTSDSGVELLRPLLEHFRSSGAESNLDPLMLAAQAYQESELDNDRESPAGALGIMQIKPSTAADRNVGIDDISSPAENIRNRGFNPTNMTGFEDLATYGFNLRDVLAGNTNILCRESTHIFMLPGWYKSLGATAERTLGLALGFIIEGAAA